MLGMELALTYIATRFHSASVAYKYNIKQSTTAKSCWYSVGGGGTVLRNGVPMLVGDLISSFYLPCHHSGQSKVAQTA